jgi:hypothetical protein
MVRYAMILILRCKESVQYEIQHAHPKAIKNFNNQRMLILRFFVRWDSQYSKNRMNILCPRGKYNGYYQSPYHDSQRKFLHHILYVGKHERPIGSHPSNFLVLHCVYKNLQMNIDMQLSCRARYIQTILIL